MISVAAASMDLFLSALKTAADLYGQVNHNKKRCERIKELQYHLGLLVKQEMRQLGLEQLAIDMCAAGRGDVYDGDVDVDGNPTKTFETYENQRFFPLRGWWDRPLYNSLYI